MAKQYKISKIEYNQKMSGKYNGAMLHTVAVESEAKRRDFVFENSKQFKVLQECATGDIVELKIVKNGDYFNLAKDDDAIVLVEKTKAEVQQETAPVIEKVAVKPYSGYKEDPDKQAAIIRQNALTNATNLIVASSKIENTDNAIKYIIATAIQFAKYTSGEDMTEYLMEQEPPWEEEKPKAARGRKLKGSIEAEIEENPHGEFGE